ncbi:hypothetical protein ADIS_4650 [Lunatimonas lonarensis]|uniref:Uncharacterized protein n=1 Tax=Lunatimonas lonarensis TaxID=1232681 RepID=R7ZLI1_9BACT|nr:hypothetical protein [Lunatimonas lonarensis]EON74956.1 hypothetical protein ADIS_4650 [Lunatimonas lonarensis]
MKFWNGILSKKSPQAPNRNSATFVETAYVAGWQITRFMGGLGRCDANEPIIGRYKRLRPEQFMTLEQIVSNT